MNKTFHIPKHGQDTFITAGAVSGRNFFAIPSTLHLYGLEIIFGDGQLLFFSGDIAVQLLQLRFPTLHFLVDLLQLGLHGIKFILFPLLIADE